MRRLRCRFPLFIAVPLHRLHKIASLDRSCSRTGPHPSHLKCFDRDHHPRDRKSGEPRARNTTRPTALYRSHSRLHTAAPAPADRHGGWDRLIVTYGPGNGVLRPRLLGGAGGGAGRPRGRCSDLHRCARPVPPPPCFPAPALALVGGAAEGSEGPCGTQRRPGWRVEPAAQQAARDTGCSGGAWQPRSFPQSPSAEHPPPPTLPPPTMKCADTQNFNCHRNGAIYKKGGGEGGGGGAAAGDAWQQDENVCVT